MKLFIKTCIVAVFCFLSVSASATKYDSIRLAESIISITQFDIFASDLIFGMFFNNMKDKTELEELKRSIRDIYKDDIKRQIAIRLLEIYNEQELQDIKKIFADKRIRNTFIAYYDMWMATNNDHGLLSQNIEQLINSLQSKHHRKPKYIRHKHYGKRLNNDPILNMLKLMDGLKGEDAVVAYQSWAKEEKAKKIKHLIKTYPQLVGQEKKLSKLYDESVDRFFIYWTLRENDKLNMRDFQLTVDAMEKNEAFRQFFVEIYNIPQELTAAIEKELKFKKWQEKAYKKQEQEKISI